MNTVKLPKLTLSLLLVAALLGIAAESPKSTYSVLTTPSEWVAKYKREQRRQENIAKWDEIKARADQGDPEAMFKLGSKMRYAANTEWTGIKRDTTEALNLISKAAGLGYVRAMVAKWTTDGSDAEEIQEMALSLIELSTSPQDLTVVGSFLNWKAVENCDNVAFELVTRIKNHLQSRDMTGFNFNYVKHFSGLEQDFESVCDTDRP